MNLENLDTVIGFVVVILLLSLVITSVVQLLGMVLRLREKALLWGIGRVITQIGTATQKDAADLAQRVVKHDSINPTRWGSATAIHFDEFIGIVKQLAERSGDQPFAAAAKSVAAAVDAAATPELEALAASVEAELAKLFPQKVALVQDAAARAKAAVRAAAPKVRFWFDTVMDRTTERFVAHTRLVTIAAAVALAGIGRIDSLDLIKQLSQKADVRAKLVQMADPVLKEAGTVLQAAPTAEGDIPRLTEQVKSLEGDLARTSLQIVPTEAFSWAYYGQHALGLLISAFFLALGAPFWFNSLRQLSNLRPIIAGKVDAKDADDSAAA
jgi:hypothetical protein